MRIPPRRWTDFPAGLRRVRVANGLTQAAFAELMGVEQATVSRWERGTHQPDPQTQDRIRDLLFHGRVSQDTLIFHYVRTAVGGRLLFSREGVILAASAAAGGRAVEGTLAARFRTPATENAMARAEAAGFFRGEVASIRFATELVGPMGLPLKLLFNWFPSRMSDGTIHVLVEADILDDGQFLATAAAGVGITMLDEILNEADREIRS